VTCRKNPDTEINMWNLTQQC